LIQVDTGQFGRPFGRLLAGLILCGALAVTLLRLPQSAAPVTALRVVYFGPSQAESDTRFARFRQAMSKRNPMHQPAVRLEYANISGMPAAQAAAAMARVMATAPHVVVTPTATLALTALAAPQRSAVVFSSIVDPLATGLVSSLRSPGLNVTGVSLFDDLDGKRLELLRDAFPAVKQVGVVVDRYWPQYADFDQALVRPAAALGLVAKPFVADTLIELHTLMQSPEWREMDAWYVPWNYIAGVAQLQIIAEIKRSNLPAIHGSEPDVAHGALMAYAQDASWVYDTLADLTLRILRGEDAGSIPIQRPKKFILAVRPRDEPGTPQINPSIIRRADRVY
jgi:putative tryptophan/tyrosine transport system substrate-binding protein